MRKEENDMKKIHPSLLVGLTLSLILLGLFLFAQWLKGSAL